MFVKFDVVITCHHVSSRVITCHHVSSRVITCHHVSSPPSSSPFETPAGLHLAVLKTVECLMATLYLPIHAQQSQACLNPVANPARLQRKRWQRWQRLQRFCSSGTLWSSSKYASDWHVWHGRDVFLQPIGHAGLQARYG